MANQYGHFVFDSELELTPSYSLITSHDFDIIDLGAGLVDGLMIFDVASVEVATNCEMRLSTGLA